MESYYSLFQAYELWSRTMSLQCEISAIFLTQDPDRWAAAIQEWASEELALAKRHFFRYDVALLCQVISNRYYPLTQTNQRYFSLAAPRDWNWDDYCGNWDARQVLEDCGLQPSDIRKAWELVLMDAKTCDPLEQWHRLTAYMAVEKRNLLKGEALRAQTWYAMEHMLRLFYVDFTGEELPTPEGPVTYKFVPGMEKPLVPHPLDDLEELCNEYSINPRPVLILVVEGESEAAVIPLMFEKLFESSSRMLGIQILPLRGIGNFTGKKGYDPQSAWVRFVDDYHSRGTIVFFMVDREGGADRRARELISKTSLYENRMVTRPEYVHLWDKNVEFDNFTDQEIATALSQLTAGLHPFSADQVAQVRNSPITKESAKGLGQLFEHVSGKGIDKPNLLAKLAESLFADVPASDSPQSREIISVLRSVLNLARQNGSQTSKWAREYRANQGLYGEMLPTTPAKSDGSENEKA